MRSVMMYSISQTWMDWPIAAIGDNLRGKLIAIIVSAGKRKF